MEQKLTSLWGEFEQTVASFEVADFQRNEELMRDAMFVYRHVVAMSKEKFAFVSCVPYSLVHCTSQEGAARVLEQFDAVPENGHHRVSIQFLSASAPGSLRAHVESVRDGGVASAELQRERNSLAWIPVTEERIEGQHRDVALEVRRASASQAPEGFRFSNFDSKVFPRRSASLAIGHGKRL